MPKPFLFNHKSVDIISDYYYSLTFKLSRWQYFCEVDLSLFSFQPNRESRVKVLVGKHLMAHLQANGHGKFMDSMHLIIK